MLSPCYMNYSTSIITALYSLLYYKEVKGINNKDIKDNKPALLTTLFPAFRVDIRTSFPFMP